MLDVKDFYLNTPMKQYEYMRIKITDIPEEVIERYRLREIVLRKTDTFIVRYAKACTAYLRRE